MELLASNCTQIHLWIKVWFSTQTLAFHTWIDLTPHWPWIRLWIVIWLGTQTNVELDVNSGMNRRLNWLLIRPWFKSISTKAISAMKFQIKCHFGRNMDPIPSIIPYKTSRHLWPWIQLLRSWITIRTLNLCFQHLLHPLKDELILEKSHGNQSEIGRRFHVFFQIF